MHLPAFPARGLALKHPRCLTVILQDPSPNKVSPCKTNLHLFYFITSCLAIAVGFSLKAFIQCCLSVVALSCAQRTLPRARGHSDTSHGTLDWCRAAQMGLRFLMQHQQEQCASAFIRSGFKPDAPGGAC